MRTIQDFVLCQDCLRALPSGLELCECGGDTCGCPSCLDAIEQLQNGELDAKKLRITGGNITRWTVEKGFI